MLGNTNGSYNAFAVINDANLGSFKSSILNASDDVFSTKLSQFLITNSDKLKILSGVITKEFTIGGKVISLNPTKANTILGRYYTEMRDLFEELGSFKNVGLGETKGGINILNKPDYYYDVTTWWNAYNKPWLDRAIARGDDIFVATEIKFDKLFDASKNEITSFGYEMKSLNDRNYKPVNFTTKQWDDAKIIINQVFK